MIVLTQANLKKIEQRPVIGTERGTPIVELAEWERDALCGLARILLPLRSTEPGDTSKMNRSRESPQ